MGTRRQAARAYESLLGLNMGAWYAISRIVSCPHGSLRCRVDHQPSGSSQFRALAPGEVFLTDLLMATSDSSVR